jgi:CheY-like chemotaxis protein
VATSSDNTKKAIGDLLKAADRSIKEAKFDEALSFVNKVFEVDEKNVYARAYRERIITLKNAEAAKVQQQKQDAASKPQKKEETKKTAATPAAEQHAPPPQKPAGGVIKKSPGAREAYKTLLGEIWKDGIITAEEQERIDAMRATFSISEDEHDSLEQEVRTELYLADVHDACTRGLKTFDDLRRKFKITENEQRAVEPTIQKYLQLATGKGTILALDDDEALLTIIRDVLQDDGYTCHIALSGEEGLELLEKINPDIVLCDINFAKPHMSGFAFYEKFRAIDRFINVPFIFLSALTEDVVVRTGKQMGVDDYLTKPFDSELLLVTIEGKLKRARELKRASLFLRK